MTVQEQVRDLIARYDAGRRDGDRQAQSEAAGGLRSLVDAVTAALPDKAAAYERAQEALRAAPEDADAAAAYRAAAQELADFRRAPRIVREG